MKLIRLIVLLVLLGLLAIFAVANRGVVTVSFDPLPFAFLPPLYLVVFAGILIGMLAGGSAAWVRTLRWRQRARNAEREARSLRDELARVRTGQATSTSTALAVRDEAA